MKSEGRWLDEIEQIRRRVDEFFSYDEMDYHVDMVTLLRGYDRSRARINKLLEACKAALHPSYGENDRCSCSTCNLLLDVIEDR